MKKILYVGVNSDDTAILSTVPLVRFYNEEQANKENIAFSYNDSQRPPHWIPCDFDIEVAKTGISYSSEYINLTKKVIEDCLHLNLTWEDEALEYYEYDEIPTAIINPNHHVKKSDTTILSD